MSTLAVPPSACGSRWESAPTLLPPSPKPVKMPEREGSSSHSKHSHSHSHKHKSTSKSSSHRRKHDSEPDEDEWIEKPAASSVPAGTGPPIDTYSTFTPGASRSLADGTSLTAAKLEPSLTDGYGEGELEDDAGEFGPSKGRTGDFFGDMGIERKRKEAKVGVDPTVRRLVVLLLRGPSLTVLTSTLNAIAANDGAIFPRTQQSALATLPLDLVLLRARPSRLAQFPRTRLFRLFLANVKTSTHPRVSRRGEQAFGRGGIGAIW